MRRRHRFLNNRGPAIAALLIIATLLAVLSMQLDPRQGSQPVDEATLDSD
jgi:hypothetical protein